MNSSIIDINLAAFEIILKRKETLMAMALENYELKRSELNMKLKSAENLNEELIVINKELEQAKKIIEQPFVQEYINIGLIRDVNAAIEHLKSSKATRTEEDERLQTLGAYRTIAGKSKEEAKEHLAKVLTMDVAEYTEDLQLVIMDTWTWKFHYSFLLQARRELASQMLAEDSTSPTSSEEGEGSSKAKSKQLDNSQLVLMIMLLDEEYNINRSDAAASLIDFICALTGRDRSNIKKLVEKAGKDDFELLTSEKKNYEDLKVIRPYFEKLKQEEVLKFIDKKINKIKSLINK
ncbi:hypothetical protein DXT99_08250 [Pontibacter diazotrophicus]|uniref:Uncharacterized protein n=1 Tax=Pontibacter diazotrophicus TaxID=1400979 RepID=A0A3D8LDJ9_9BACT|nr:hypothetical protein [Pontibacter diazotrophicus]RDV15477.1 hypothetical protein DXT99_08250 [Pontibacter diazotrophicus]